MSPDTQPAPQTCNPVALHGLLTLADEDGEDGRLDGYRPRAEMTESPVDSLTIQSASATCRDEPSELIAAEPEFAKFSRSRRALLTCMFTDIVASTETLERVGDKEWCARLAHHHHLVRERLKAYRGREVDAAGDGFFLIFDGPSLAVQFAVAVRTALRAIGINLRVGIHTGECEVINGRVEGVAVHTAARVASAAAAGEILVSSTVREVVAGSDHCFSKRDVRILKGLSEPRQLFALECPEV